jgi:hypothetical protein
MHSNPWKPLFSPPSPHPNIPPSGEKETARVTYLSIS